MKLNVAGVESIMNKGDRELLELASKAAGQRIDGFTSDGTPYWGGPHDSVVAWNPLTDDGDALRLAVKLRIDVKWHFGLNDSVFAGVAYKETTQVRERLNVDDFAATRRAIVRAAAEIGKTK